jgi:hypothetical protein
MHDFASDIERRAILHLRIVRILVRVRKWPTIAANPCCKALPSIAMR